MHRDATDEKFLLLAFSKKSTVTLISSTSTLFPKPSATALDPFPSFYPPDLGLTPKTSAVLLFPPVIW